MKHLPLLLWLVGSPVAFCQAPVPEQTITPEILAEFLEIESFEAEYEMPAAPVDVNMEFRFTTFDESGKQTEDRDVGGGVGHIYKTPPSPAKKKLLLMISPDKGAIYTWDDTFQKYGCNAWGEGWKRHLSKVKQSGASVARGTRQIKLEIGKRETLKTWTMNDKKVAEVSFLVTTKPYQGK